MSAIKLCGMTRLADIESVNGIRPEFIGFVFWKPSKRYVTPEAAAELKAALRPEIEAVGVFVDEDVKAVAALAERGIIDRIQLHGEEDEDYIRRLRELTDKPILQAIRIVTMEDAERAERSAADHILLDSGKGGGKTIDWAVAEKISRPYFLAGGLNTENVEAAVKRLHPYAVDVSSGIETDGKKDPVKMRSFADIVRSTDR
ncbi:MAG: phosphoribosylanthranilate isomerase [Lachnospiraceae bacterium]|nr:phosphoribosylanthranilate isomerase [Lachnospiraceae bacterium]